MSSLNLQTANIETYAVFLFQSVPEAIVIAKHDGEIIQANQLADELFDYKQGELVGQSIEILVPSQYRTIHQAKRHTYNQNPHQRQMADSIELNACRSDNTIFPVQISLNPIEIQGENYTICMVKDITEQKEFEAKLHEAELLQIKSFHEKETLQLRERFVAMASHDLRTPLSSISTSAEILRNYGNRLSDERKEIHWKRIDEQINYMIALLDDILSVSRMSDTTKFDLKPTNLIKLCEDICDSLHLKHDPRFSFNCSKQLDIIADTNIIRNVLDNLLTNAKKYSGGEDTIELDIRLASNMLHIKVADSGRGIPKDDLNKLFEPFHRAQNVGNIRGTGLGLTIVKKNVDLYGGTIDVTSEVNEGTTFIVRLPVHENIQMLESI